MALETVSYQDRLLSGALSATYTGVVALLRSVPGALQGLGRGAQAAEKTATWHIRADTLAVVPKRGDRIVSSSSGTWEVLEAATETLATRYRCRCKQISGR